MIDLGNYLFLAMFVLLGIFMLLIQRKYFILLFQFYFFQLWTILSCIYIETGIYITEQNVYSYKTGATMRLCFYNMIFFIMIIIIKFLRDTMIIDGIYWVRKYKKTSNFKVFNRRIYTSVIILIFLSICILYYNLFISGIPLLSKGVINKVTFFTQYSRLRIADSIYAYIDVISFTLGMIYFINLKKSLLSTISKVCYILLLLCIILMGNKFSPIVSTLYAFMLPILIGYKGWDRKKIGKLITFGVLLCIVILLLSGMYYKYQGEKNFIAFIFYRIFGLQGHMWWTTDRIASIGGDSHQLWAEINEIVNPTAEKSTTGMKFLMILISGEYGLESIKHKVMFTMSYPAIAIYALGAYKTVLFQVFIGILVELVIYCLYRSIKREELFTSLVLYKILFDFIQFYQTGVISRVFSIKNLVYLMFIIVYYIIFNFVNTSLVTFKKSMDNV